MNLVKLEKKEILGNENLDKSIIDVIYDFLKKYETGNDTFKKLNNTQKSYKKDLITFFELINIKSLNDLKFVSFNSLSNMINDYINSFKKIENDRIINSKTLNRKLYSLKSFFNYLIYNFNYPKNPCNLRVFKIDNKSNTDILDENELKKILNYLKSKYEENINKDKEILYLKNYLMFGLLVLSLRRNEVVNLIWSNFFEDKQYLKVLQKGSTHKYIPLPSALFYGFQKYRTLKNKYNYNTNYIFSPIKNETNGNLNKKINTSYIYRLVKKVIDKLGINKDISPHSFRSSFVSLNLDKGEDYSNIMNTTGHKQVQTLMIYDKRDKIENNSAKNMGYLF